MRLLTRASGRRPSHSPRGPVATQYKHSAPSTSLRMSRQPARWNGVLPSARSTNASQESDGLSYGSTRTSCALNASDRAQAPRTGTVSRDTVRSPIEVNGQQAPLGARGHGIGTGSGERKGQDGRPIVARNEPRPARVGRGLGLGHEAELEARRARATHL